jgi:hypothetical protein
MQVVANLAELIICCPGFLPHRLGVQRKLFKLPVPAKLPLSMCDYDVGNIICRKGNAVVTANFCNGAANDQ